MCKKLKIYFTSDVHGYVYPTDYRDEDDKPIGILNIITDIKNKMNDEDKENTLIIDGGDVLQGSPFVTFLAKNFLGTEEKLGYNPIVDIANAMKYDYITFGNHDFNYGYEFLKNYIDNIQAKCLSTNIQIKAEGDLDIYTYDIKELKNGLRVGIMGFTTDFITKWEKPENIEKFTISDTFKSIDAIFNTLKTEKKCDLIIGVYHGGVERDLDDPNTSLLSSSAENIACKICESYSFDILLTGHQHKSMENKNYKDTHIVQTPIGGKQYIRLECCIDDTGKKQITSNLLTPPINPDKDLALKFSAFQEHVLTSLKNSIGTLDTRLQAPPDENDGKYYEHAKMASEGSLLANFANQVQLDACEGLANISITSFANSISGIEKAVTLGDVITTYPYPNTLVIKKVTGKNLRCALERSASYFAIVDGRVCVSNLFLSPKVEHYNYDYYSNIFYTFDITKNVGERVGSVKFEGKEISDTDIFNIVMNNYRAGGAGGYDFYADCENVGSPPAKEIAELIVNYVEKYSKDENIIEVDKTKYITCISQDRVQKIPANIVGTAMVDVNVRSFAGYAKAKFGKVDAELFYWFFESQKFHPDQFRDKNKDEIGKTPLIIWLNGGPGSSSTIGLFLENGPYRILDGADCEIIENKYSWNKDTHLMYWDQPIGAGYSRVLGEKQQTTFAKNEDELSEMFFFALQDFFEKHPEYRSCPLYITGESYAGKYVPYIATKIHDKNSGESENKINLKGFAVGDGWINARLQNKVYIDYAYTMGYLDVRQKEQMLKYYEEFCVALDHNDYKKAYTISANINNDISALGGDFDAYDIRSFTGISIENLRTYMELDAVKDAVHIPRGQNWNCADDDGPVADNLAEDNMDDSSPVYENFIKHDKLYKVLMYAATFDTACGALSTELILNSLNKWGNPEDNEKWETLQREIWAQPSNSVKGFVKQYKNLTQIVLPNSGHLVPYYIPEDSRDMIYKWINGDTFPTYCPQLKNQ